MLKMYVVVIWKLIHQLRKGNIKLGEGESEGLRPRFIKLSFFWINLFPSLRFWESQWKGNISIFFFISDIFLAMWVKVFGKHIFLGKTDWLIILRELIPVKLLQFVFLFDEKNLSINSPILYILGESSLI